MLKPISPLSFQMWLASCGECSSDVSCCWVEKRTEDELHSIHSLHPIIIHCHISVEQRASVHVKTGARGRLGASMSGVYYVSYAQTVQKTLVTSCHSETRSQAEACVFTAWAQSSYCMGILLVAYVEVGPDLIDMASWSPVCQQKLLQLWDRRSFVWRIP